MPVKPIIDTEKSHTLETLSVSSYPVFVFDGIEDYYFAYVVNGSIYAVNTLTGNEKIIDTHERKDYSVVPKNLAFRNTLSTLDKAKLSE